MKKLITTPYMERVKMGEFGRKKMEAQFDRQIVAKMYIEGIEKTVGIGSKV